MLRGVSVESERDMIIRENVVAIFFRLNPYFIPKRAVGRNVVFYNFKEEDDIYTYILNII